MMNSMRMSPFNSPIESGVRTLTILLAIYPNAIDLQGIVELDYFVLHSADIGGPESLHAPLPYRSGELLIRRGVIDAGITLFLSRGLVDRVVSSRGIEYMASDSAFPFINSLNSSYIQKLKMRADWAYDKVFKRIEVGDGAREKISSLWRTQFQNEELLKGGAL